MLKSDAFAILEVKIIKTKNRSNIINKLRKFSFCHKYSPSFFYSLINRKGKHLIYSKCIQQLYRTLVLNAMEIGNMSKEKKLFFLTTATKILLLKK